VSPTRASALADSRNEGPNLENTTLNIKSVLRGVAAFAILPGAVAAYWISSEAWKQTCLGVFEDKFVCEVTREHRVHFRRCAEKSWRTCESKRTGADRGAYEDCLDAVRCPCMKSFGEEICDYF